jgi:uncharacterized protein
MKKIFVIIIVLAYMVSNAYESRAQDSTSDISWSSSTTMAIRIKYKTKILLHWVPLNPNHWQNGGLNGYNITRYNLDAGNVESNPFQSVVLPLPIGNTQWDVAKAADPPNAVQIDVAKDGVEVLSDPANYNNNQVTVYMAMAATSINYKAAHLAGLTFDDATATPGQKYRYYIYPRSTTNDTNKGTEYVDMVADANAMANLKGGINNIQTAIIPIPAPKLFYDKEQSITLKWKYKFDLLNNSELSNIFSGFNIERSLDNVTFQKLNSNPIVKAGSNGKLNTAGTGYEAADSLLYTDTVPNETKTYYYRIVGITYFGETEASPSVIIRTKYKHSALPSIESWKNINTTQYKTSWVFRDFVGNGSANQVVAFPRDSVTLYRLLISNSDSTGLYKALPTASIDYNLKSSLINKSDLVQKVDTSKSYYLKLEVVLNSGTILSSLPYFMTKITKLPPAKPTGFTATSNSSLTDSLYIINLTWNKINTPKPLKYQVLRKFNGDSESLEISKGIENTGALKDTLAGKNSYPQITYYLIAYDEDFNPSEPAIITYTKPDNIRPLPPIIKSYEVNNLNVKLYFQFGNDTDLASIFLFRKKASEDGLGQQILAISPSNLPAYHEDMNLTNGETYIYYMIAKDLNNNESCYEIDENGNCLVPAQFVPVKILSTKKDPILDFKGVLNLDFPSENLTWTKPISPDIERIELYKNELVRASSSSNSYTFWKSLPADAITLTDFDVKFFSTYQYRIRAVYKDGTMSPMSTLSVFLPNKDGCASGTLVIENSTVIPTDKVVNDVACFEIKLKPGFQAKAANGVKYSGKIIGN